MNCIKQNSKKFSRMPKIKFIGKRGENQEVQNAQSTLTSAQINHAEIDSEELSKINQELLKNRDESINSIRNLWKYRSTLSDKEVDEYNYGVHVKDWNKIKVSNDKH